MSKEKNTTNTQQKGNKVNKNELLNMVIDLNKTKGKNAVEFTKKQAEAVIENLYQCIITSLKKGDIISITRLGTLHSYLRSARVAKNPNTGQMSKIDAMLIPQIRFLE